MRILAPNALLYTEMHTCGAIQNNPRRALYLDPIEHPIALQLGGADKKSLVHAAQTAEDAGYDEVNLNLGCPSDKVQAGQFGACLMKEPQKVAECIQAMQAAVRIPITAKTRIGIDNQDSYEFFSAFAHQLIDAGCQKLVVHARKAWLNGLNPKQNRSIPPVHYDYVYRIKAEFPHIPVVINGNINSEEAIQNHLKQVDGVMLGRLACDNPYAIALIHHMIYPDCILLKPSEAFAVYKEYALEELNKGVSLSILLKPLFNLAFGMAGARVWKKKLMTLLQSKDLTLFNELSQYLFEIESVKSNECI